MIARVAFAAAAFSVALLAAAGSNAGTRRPPWISLGVSSQQAGSHRASVSASIAVRDRRLGRNGTNARDHVQSQAVSVRRGGETGEPYPALPSTSPLLRSPHPLGPNTFWYSDGSGHVCVYGPSSSALCYTVRNPRGGATAGPAISPAAIAAALAARLELAPGRIEASPAAAHGGLTGADSWFWLAPPPRREVLSISLRGESVSVSAEPSVEWRFGDGGSLVGGPGRPYAPGPPPADAVRHLYETRCLPGDAGRNPYVLASCGSGGYAVEALVHWSISFVASGALSASGSLPARTTSTGISYRVSEARGFLVGGVAR
jgi:hypothetical protein